MNNRSKKGFTLVEIMIVVVIIGLLAAMAIPAFQKVRASSIEKTMLNDARQLGAAAQQYCMEYGETSVTYAVTLTTGEVTGPLTPWLKQISKNYAAYDGTIEVDSTQAFTLQKNGAFSSAVVTFDGEGKKQN